MLAKKQGVLVAQERDTYQCSVAFSVRNNVSNTIVSLKSIISQLEKKKGNMPVHSVEIYDDRLTVKLGREEADPVKRPSSLKEKLLLIDGSNMLSVSYYATAAKETGNLFNTSSGKYTNAVFTMTRKLLHLIHEYEPTHLAIAWDLSRSTFRRDLYPEYKANRKETDPALKEQFETAQSLFEKMNISQFMMAGYEADDLIGTIARKWWRKNSGTCYIVSNDKDLYQLLNPQTVLIVQRKGKEEIVTYNSFRERYNILPRRWVDVKAILGDPSDNIPGVKGVGEKAAIPLIQHFESIENLYDNLASLEEGRFKRYMIPLQQGERLARLSKELATIITKVPLDIDLDALRIDIDKQSMIEEFEKLEFRSLLKEIRSGKFRRKTGMVIN